MEQTQKRLAWKPGTKGKYHGRQGHLIKSRPLASFVKTAIVTAALRKWLPPKLAGWLIQRGGLRHV